MDSYGVVNPNTTIPVFQTNMYLAYGTDGAAVYRPMIPPPLPPPFQAVAGNGSPAPQPQARKKRGRPRKNEVERGTTVSPLPPPPPPEVGFQTAVGGCGDGSYMDAEEGGRNMGITYSTDGAAVHRPVMKRGRPRKHTVEESGLSSPAAARLQAVFQASGLSSPAPAAASSSSGKKARGRPKGAKGCKQEQVADMGGSLSMQRYPWSAGLEFTPHCIIVQAGEDITRRIMSFSENGRRDLFVLSAIGAISNVTLRQGTSGGTITYEGRFDMVCLSISYILVESEGQSSRASRFSVNLAGPDHRVFGGSVAGVLTAATSVQVIFGSSISRGEDLKSPTQAGEEDLKSPTQAGEEDVKSPAELPAEADPSTAPPNLVPGASAAFSSISWGTMSDSSGGPGSPLNQSTRSHNGGSDQQELNSFWLN